MAYQHLVQCIPIRLLEVPQLLTQFLGRTAIESKVALLHEDFGVLTNVRLVGVRLVCKFVVNIRYNTMSQHRHL